jgi:hypothetical protein
MNDLIVNNTICMEKTIFISHEKNLMQDNISHRNETIFPDNENKLGIIIP